MGNNYPNWVIEGLRPDPLCKIYIVLLSPYFALVRKSFRKGGYAVKTTRCVTNIFI